MPRHVFPYGKLTYYPKIVNVKSSANRTNTLHLNMVHKNDEGDVFLALRAMEMIQD